jgi:hypothetical protein
MSIEARIKALEGKLSIDYITLRLSDGSERKIRGDNLVDVLCASMRREYAKTAGLPIPVSQYDSEIDLIARSVSNDEEGSLINLIQVLAHGPAPTPSESEASK